MAGKKKEKLPGYLERILSIIGENPNIAIPGKVGEISVVHKKTCKSLGGGECDCNPWIFQVVKS
jgi:hypothetical protein